MPLQFNLTIKKPKGVDPRYLKTLMLVNNNTPPIFVDDKYRPIPYIPKQTFNADVPPKKDSLPLIWDQEKNKVEVTNDFIKANVSAFLVIERTSPAFYRVVASPKAKHVGNYSTTITLTDDHKYPLSTRYKVEIEIIPNPDAKPPVKPVRTILKVI